MTIGRWLNNGNNTQGIMSNPPILGHNALRKLVTPRYLVVNQATERRAGEMLTEMEKHPGGLSLDVTTPPTKLEELGISRMQSHRWQLEASVPDERK